MLYEEVILRELEAKGFPRGQVVRYLDANRHNHATTCYYLILNKRERDGEIEVGRYYSGVNFIPGDMSSATKSRDGSLAPSSDCPPPTANPASRSNKISLRKASASAKGGPPTTSGSRAQPRNLHSRAVIPQEQLERQYMSE